MHARTLRVGLSVLLTPRGAGLPAPPTSSSTSRRLCRRSMQRLVRFKRLSLSLLMQSSPPITPLLLLLLLLLHLLLLFFSPIITLTHAQPSNPCLRNSSTKPPQPQISTSKPQTPLPSSQAATLSPPCSCPTPLPALPAPPCPPCSSLLARSHWPPRRYLCLPRRRRLSNCSGQPLIPPPGRSRGIQLACAGQRAARCDARRPRLVPLFARRGGGAAGGI
jgi:hypothetical protein